MSSLFIQLVTGKRILNPLWEKPSYRLKFFSRTFFMYPITLKWLSILENYPFVDLFLVKQHNLPTKLQRPYLASSLSSKHRFLALKSHYDFLSSQPKSLTEALYQETPFKLSSFSGKNETLFTIEITASDKYSREGELTLFFKNTEHKELASLTFSLIDWQGKKTLFIAGLQGAERSVDDPKQAISQATKSCFGAFPKRLLVDTVLEIAHFLKFKQVMAVSNKTHIYNNWRYRQRFNQLHADYDSFWLSLNAELKSDRFFYLPTILINKPIEEVASKKRSEYKQRYQLLDRLKAEITMTLSQLIQNN